MISFPVDLAAKILILLAFGVISFDVLSMSLATSSKSASIGSIVFLPASPFRYGKPRDQRGRAKIAVSGKNIGLRGDQPATKHHSSKFGRLTGIRTRAPNIRKRQAWL